MMRRCADRESGFTLIEVMVAVFILSLGIVPLLIKNAEILRSAGESRNMRHAWVLLTQKAGELEMDKNLLRGDYGVEEGDFSDLGPTYREFRWKYEYFLEEVKTNKPGSAQEKPKEIYRLVVTVDWSAEAADDEKKLQASVTAYLPVPAKSPTGK